MLMRVVLMRAVLVRVVLVRVMSIRVMAILPSVPVMSLTLFFRMFSE